MLIDTQSPHVKEVQYLRSREYRRKSGCVIVEGYPEVSRALKAQVPLKNLFICPEILPEAADEFAAFSPQLVSKDVFAAMAFGQRLKGILAICKPQALAFDRVELSDAPIVIILENVEKPGNLGTILRSADGAGVDLVIHCDAKTDLYNHHVVRSSTGTIFTVPVLEADRESTEGFLKQKNLPLICSTAKADQLFTEVDYKKGCAIILGSEHEGVSDFWQEKSQERIKIPMMGDQKCLNVAMSASIVMYEARRQKGA